MKYKGFKFEMQKIRRRSALFLTVLMLVMISDCSIYSWASEDSGNDADSEIYVDPQAGDDTNDGSAPDQALKTLETAVDKQTENQDLTVVLMDTVSMTDGDTTLSGKESGDLTIRRYEDFHDEMFELSGNASLTLDNITVDEVNDADGEDIFSLVHLDGNSELNFDEGATPEDDGGSARPLSIRSIPSTCPGK